MMAWLLTLSYFLTNELRLYAGLFLVARATGFRPRRVAVLLAGIFAVVLMGVYGPGVQASEFVYMQF